jgi:hypothetical protein
MHFFVIEIETYTGAGVTPRVPAGARSESPA